MCVCCTIQLLRQRPSVMGVDIVMPTPVMLVSVMLHMLGMSVNTVPVASMECPRKKSVIMYMHGNVYTYHYDEW